MKKITYFITLLCTVVSCEKDGNNFNPNSSTNIEFKDNVVKTALLDYVGVDMNHDREISYNEASSVKTLSGCFDQHRDKIYEFEELRYFTGLQTIDKLFYECTNLKRVILPEIATIGEYAFYGCSSLEELVIPDSVKDIKKYSLAKCSSLKNISIPADVTRINEGVFSKSGLTKITLHSNITEVMYAAFYQCNALESVVINGQLEYLANDLFNGCQLKKVDIPNSVKWIGWDAFKANQFVSVSIPSGVESISSNAFFDCDKLKTINISETVKSLGNGVFYGCNSLESIYLRGANPPYFSGGYPTINQNVSIYVPRNAVNTYKTNDDWVMYANQIVGHDY